MLPDVELIPGSEPLLDWDGIEPVIEITYLKTA